eukprot:1159820-Pelagomonas_calceolata.AAC.9
MDVNQPDSKGRMPLLEAVKTKDIKFVDGLLQYRALAASVDPATGTNPLMEAFKLGLTEVSASTADGLWLPQIMLSHRWAGTCWRMELTSIQPTRLGRSHAMGKQRCREKPVSLHVETTMAVH